MEDDYTGGDICIDGSTDCIGNDIVYGSRTYIHLKLKPRPNDRGFNCVEGTLAREYKEKFIFLWYSAHLIVPLNKVLPFGKEKKNELSFCFSLI